MKNKLYWLLVVVLILSALGGTPQKVLAQRASPPLHADISYVPGQMIVVYRKGLSQEMRVESSNSIAEALSGKVLEMRGNAALLSVDKNLNLLDFTANFNNRIQAMHPGITAQINNVAYTQPNIILAVPGDGPGVPDDYNPPIPRPNGDNNDEADPVELKKSKSTPILPTYPEDPLLGNTWGWWSTSADVIWQDKLPSPAVCLLDTGVDAAHPDLIRKIIPGKDVVNDDSIPDDDNGHGTHLAGIIAATSNNQEGIAGITTKSKILAIKVLDFQGRGDSWDIAYGINSCANNLAVKIINMSFGSYYPDQFIYDALQYAIVQKGKLAVAAAGNLSTSDFVFPAAWAGDFVCRDGSYYIDTVTKCLPPDLVPNFIADGMISVGASRSYWSDSFDGYHGGSVGDPLNPDRLLWVDTNGDGAETSNENYYMPWCAAAFSNFGAWVSIVAPGENITSTVPVSYPFYEQYNWNADSDGDGYDTWNGTSMAAPFVTGAAARVWSLGNSLLGIPLTNKLVKNRLVSSGYSVVTALDPNTTPINWGYDSEYSSYPPTHSSFLGEAPYCWPDASMGPLYNMSNTRMLNVADAMNRTSLYVYLYNALNGLPLRGATVGAYIGTTTTPKSRALIDSNVSPVAVLPNLPRGKTYDIKINKKGFTLGQVSIKKFFVDPAYGAYQTDPSLSVSVPPTGKITGVIDWIVYDTSVADMDLYAWLPQGADPANGDGAVGYYLGGAPFIGKGRLLDFPRARWNLDSGWTNGYSLYDWAATESISIKPRPGVPSMPYYNTTAARHYDFLVHEWQTGALNNNDIYFRLWVGGKIKSTVIKLSTDATKSCAPGATWWQPGYMKLDKFIEVNSCGTSSMWPY